MKQVFSVCPVVNKPQTASVATNSQPESKKNWTTNSLPSWVLEQVPHDRSRHKAVVIPHSNVRPIDFILTAYLTKPFQQLMLTYHQMEAKSKQHDKFGVPRIELM